jgi:hypothetical protein
VAVVVGRGAHVIVGPCILELGKKFTNRDKEMIGIFANEIEETKKEILRVGRNGTTQSLFPPPKR